MAIQWWKKKFSGAPKILHNLKYCEIFAENLVCVSKGANALDGHKKIQNYFFVYLQEKVTKLNSWQCRHASSQYCRYQSQQITENVFKTEQKSSHHQINIY